MIIRLVALFVVLSFTSAAYAGGNPTIEEVNASPGKFVGQTLMFKNVRLDGDVTIGQVRFRFTLKSPRGTMFLAQPVGHPEQALVFATHNKDRKEEKFVKTLNPENVYRVNMRVTIQPMGGKGGQQGRFWAQLESVDHVLVISGYKRD